MNLEKYVNMLGTVQRDKVTEFEGVATSVCFDAYGCVQVNLTAKVGRDGEAKQNWYDSNRLVDQKKRVMPVPSFDYEPTEHRHGPSASRPPARR